MRIYSQSQGRFIDAPEQGTASMGNGGREMTPLQLLLGEAILSGKASGADITGLQALGLIPPQKSVEERKAEKSLTGLERRIGLVEKLWFPNEDKLALEKPKNFLGRWLGKKGKEWESSSEYLQFQRQVRTLGATLAKAAGDTGNIAWAEQAAQLQAMADADMTKEEAQQRFQNVREGLGLEVKDESYYDALRQGKTPSKLDTLLGATSKTQELASGRKTLRDVFPGLKTPLDPTGKKVLGGLEGFLQTPVARGTGQFMGGATSGGTLGFVKPEEMFPSIGKPKGGGEQALRTTGAVVGALNPKGLPAKAFNILRAGPVGLLGKLRSRLAPTAPIPTTSVAEAAVNTQLPIGMGRAAQPAQLESIGQFAGKSEQATKLFDVLTGLEKAARQGAKGDYKQTASALVQKQAATALRQLLKEQAPAASKVSSAMSPFIKTGQFLGRFGKAITSPFAIGGVVGAGLLGKLLYGRGK